MVPSLPVIVKAFGIIGPILDKTLKSIVSFRVHCRSQICQSDLSPDFVATMLFVLIDYSRKMVQCFLQPILAARNAAELVMCIGFCEIDLDSMSEPLDRLFVLMATLKDESQLIMSFSIVSVDRGCFHRVAKALTLPQRESDIADVTTEHV